MYLFWMATAEGQNSDRGSGFQAFKTLHVSVIVVLQGDGPVGSKQTLNNVAVL